MQQLRASGLAFGVIECCGALKSCSGASEWQQGLEILELMGGAEEWCHVDVERCGMMGILIHVLHVYYTDTYLIKSCPAILCIHYIYILIYIYIYIHR